MCASSVRFARYGYPTGPPPLSNRTSDFEYGDYQYDYGDYQDDNTIPYLQRSTRSVMSALEKLYQELNEPPSS